MLAKHFPGGERRLLEVVRLDREQHQLSLTEVGRIVRCHARDRERAELGAADFQIDIREDRTRTRAERKDDTRRSALEHGGGHCP